MKRLLMITALFGMGICLLKPWNGPAINTLHAQAPVAESPAKPILDAYAKAINDRNYEAIANFWADNADHIDEDGTLTNGRANIAALLKKALGDAPKAQVSFRITQTKQLGTEVMLVDGVAELKDGDSSDETIFESVWLKTNNVWQLSRVREIPSDPPEPDSNFGYLKELEWLVGNWQCDSGTFSVTMNVEWTRNKNFLKLEQLVKAEGKEDISLTKIIGYDPARKSLRLWVFDSEGGFGGGLITRDGNADSWTAETETLTRTAGESTLLQTTKKLDQNSFEWKAIQRELNGQALPDLSVKYTRKPQAK
jgi:ketosteroid isomerase-like protein